MTDFGTVNAVSADACLPSAPSCSLPKSSHMHAAVDREICARDETRVVRTEKRDERGDLIGLTESANWNLRQYFCVHDVHWNRGGHRSRQIAGRHRIDRHAMFRDLKRKRHREAVNACL